MSLSKTWCVNYLSYDKNPTSSTPILTWFNIPISKSHFSPYNKWGKRRSDHLSQIILHEKREWERANAIAINPLVSQPNPFYLFTFLLELLSAI